ncbi:MAG: sulfatase [Sedimentisphaerales bacterium]|nr:sulfatase [Sedimentisphaerales bacterium]
MNRRRFIQSVTLGTTGAILSSLNSVMGASTRDRDRPNAVFILADDLGRGQVGCYGNPFYETPNIDRLAREGMRFTDAYAACPVCSPTRASIMTGKYPARLHITDFIAGGDFPHERLRQPDWQKFLPLEEFTLGELFEKRGYVTASFGKWHLSTAKLPPASAPYDPDKQGFDETFLCEKPSSKQGPESDAHHVEEITRKSLAFLERHRDEPFFLLMAHCSIHAPIMSKACLVARHKAKGGANRPENNPVIAAMMEELDGSVGRVLQRLEELKLADNTIVIFFSDNGGLEADAKQTPLRSGKANLYEGGIRVPFIVRWPGVVKPGITCGEPVISTDFFPTFRDILQARDAGQGPIDGVSLLPLLAGTGSVNRPAIYWHYPHYHGSSVGPCGAVRARDYKLIEWFDESVHADRHRLELYNLKDDPGERDDLAARRPAKAEQMHRMLELWRCDVGAQIMSPNRDYDPKKARRSK